MPFKRWQKPVRCWLACGWLVLLLPLACNRGETAKGYDAVKARGELRVAMSGQYPPFNYTDAANQLVGFDVDIATEVAKRLELRPRFMTLRWDGILAGLTAGRYDLIIGSMAITPERRQAVDFSEPYYTSGAQVFARPDSQVARSGSLAGAVLGVNLGTTYESAVRQLATIKDVRTYGGIAEILLDLANRRLDAFVTDRLVGLHARQVHGGSFEPVGGLLYEETIAVAMAKDQPALRAAVDGALHDLNADGTYARLSLAWFGRDIREPAVAPGGRSGEP